MWPRALVSRRRGGSPIAGVSLRLSWRVFQMEMRSRFACRFTRCQVLHESWANSGRVLRRWTVYSSGSARCIAGRAPHRESARLCVQPTSELQGAAHRQHKASRLTAPLRNRPPDAGVIDDHSAFYHSFPKRRQH